MAALPEDGDVVVNDGVLVAGRFQPQHDPLLLLGIVIVCFLILSNRRRRTLDIQTESSLETHKWKIYKTSPQAKRHKPSLLFTSLDVLTSVTFIIRKLLSLHNCLDTGQTGDGESKY